MTGIFDKLNPLAIVIIAAIIAILITALIVSNVIRKKYKSIGQALDTIRDGGNKSSHRVLELIIGEYRESASQNPDEVNTQAIIEKNFNNELRGLYFGERFIKNSTSLMIVLGLLGTFYGLTLSIGKLVELLSDSSNVEVLSSMDSIVGGLINSVKGMSVAFVTSLFGIASSIILTIVNIINNVEENRESVMIEIEEYLDNTVALEFRRNKADEHTVLAHTIRNTLKDLGGSFESNLKYTLDTYGENLALTTKSIENASLALLKTIDMFDNSLERFSENTRDFTEFNHHLRTNIDRMNVSFSDFTDELKTNTKDLSRGHEAYKELASSIEKLRDKQ